MYMALNVPFPEAIQTENCFAYFAQMQKGRQGKKKATLKCCKKVNTSMRMEWKTNTEVIAD